MDETRVISALAATLDPSTQKAASDQLNQMQKIAGFPVCLLNCLKTPTVPAPVKQSTAVYLKNIIEKYYTVCGDDDSKFVIHETDKAHLRANILECLVVTPENVRNQLIVCIKKMIKHDYKAEGPWRDDLNEKILQFLKNSDNNRYMWLSGLLVLLQLIKVFEYVKQEDQDRVYFMEAMKIFLPQMQSMAQNLAGNEQEDAALLLKIILKSFFALSQWNLPIDLFGSDNAAQWIQILTTVISQDLPDPSEDKDESEKMELPHWKSKKWALHISNRLFEKYGAPGKVEDQFEEFAKFFMANAAVPLLKTQLSLLDRKTNNRWVSPRCCQLILSYIEICVGHSHTWAVIRGSIFTDLVKDICFPLMCFSEEDANLWEEDPEEYIRSKFDIFAETTSAKSAAESLVCTACVKRKDILGQVMNYAQSMLASLTEFQPEQVDGIFNLICCVSEQLMKKKPYKSQIDLLTQQFFIPLCQSNQSYLRARGLFCIKSFADAKLKKATIVKVFEIALNLLANNVAVGENGEDQDINMPVQVEAAMALSQLASKHQEKASQFMKNNIGEILKHILELTTKTAQDDLLDVVKEFISEFAEEVEPFATELAESISHQFIQMASSANESDEDYDNKCLTSVGMLTTLESLLDILQENETLIVAAEAVVTNVIAWVLSHQKMDYYEEAFSLLSSITTYHVKDNVWDGLPLLKSILEADDHGGVDYFVDMMPALHNFITVESPKFFAENNNLQIIFSMIKYVLDSADSGEEAETHALKLLEVLIFQGGAHVTGVIRNAINMAYSRGCSSHSRPVETSEMRTMITTVLLAALFVDQTEDTISFLQEKGWIEEGIKQWISDFDSIFGIHDRRVSILVMAKFLSSGRKFPAIIESASAILPSCLKLFKGLESAYEYRANEDSDDDCDNDSDDEFNMNEGDKNLTSQNVNRGNIEQLEDDESDEDTEGKEYLRMMENFRLNEEVDIGETQYEDYTTVIDEDGIPYLGLTKDKDGTVEQHDTPDEYVEFQKALDYLSNSDSGLFNALMSSLSDEDKRDFTHVQNLSKKRLESQKSKELERQGGYRFETDVTKIDMNFTSS